jgi:DNA replication protein DnaC
MLREPLIDKLASMKLNGMLEGLREQMENPQYRKLSFEERLGLIMDREWNLRQDRGLRRRLQVARFREEAVMEDVELSSKRGLERSLVLYLGGEEWIRQKLNVIITGPTGAGKTYLACALGHAACRNHFSVRYFQISRLLQKLNLSQADGSWPKFLNSLAKAHLLIIDDWLRTPLSKTQTNEILEIIEDRYKRSSTLLATQIPVTEWLERMADPTLSDAVMDRIVHNAYRLELKGESMRKTKSMLTHAGHPEVK